MTERDLGDEHAADPELLQMTLDDCRQELTRLRGLREPMYVQVGSGGQLPQRVWPGDAGFDLHVSDDCMIEPSSFVDVPCSVRVQLPANMWALIVGRSSTIRKRGLMVAQGIIDSGYRGELFSGVWNLTPEPILVEKGERLAQLIPMPLTAAHVALIPSLELDRGDRGQAGFGSTGT